MAIDETVISLLSNAFDVDPEEVGEDTDLHELGWDENGETDVERFMASFLMVFCGYEEGEVVSRADEGVMDALRDCVTVGDVVKLAERLAEE